MKKHETLEYQLYIMGWIFLTLGCIGILVYFTVYLPYFQMPCVFLKLFGVYCPGCGGTRAVEALLHGHFLRSLWYHPLVLYTVIVFGGFMTTQTLERLHVPKVKGWKFHTWHLYGALVVLVINFILKNVLKFGFHIEM